MVYLYPLGPTCLLAMFICGLCGSMAGGADEHKIHTLSAWESKQEPQLTNIFILAGSDQPLHIINTQTAAGWYNTRQLDCVKDV